MENAIEAVQTWRRLLLVGSTAFLILDFSAIEDINCYYYYYHFFC